MAKDLKQGERCFSCTSRHSVFVCHQKIEIHSHVYNLEIEQNHTYYTGKSPSDSVLVHNSCSRCGASNYNLYHFMYGCPVAEAENDAKLKARGLGITSSVDEVRTHTGAADAAVMAENFAMDMPGFTQINNIITLQTSKSKTEQFFALLDLGISITPSNQFTSGMNEITCPAKTRGLAAKGKKGLSFCFVADTQVLVGQTETVTSTAVQTNETEVRYHSQEGNYGSFIVTLVFGASAVVLKTTEKKRKRQKEIEQQYFKDLFTDLDVDPVDLHNKTLERIAGRQPALQGLWNESPETCTEVLFSELETSIQSNKVSATVNPEKKLHPKKSTTGWLGYAGTFFFILAIISFLWNFLPSDNKAEAVSQVAAKPVPDVETKYVTKNIEDIHIGERTLGTNHRE